MTELIITRYIHIISFIMVFATVFAESRLVQPVMTRAAIKKVFSIDALYGLFALSTLGAGLYLWFGTGKPSSFYSANYIFHIKVAVFLIVGILSIWPTMFFRKNSKGNQSETIDIPLHIRRIIKLELALLVLIPVLAVMMAQGIGFIG